MSIITLTGPTCAGKSTIEKELQLAGCGRAISHTTRQPRAGEEDGVHYHFIDDATFERLNAEGEFIETISFGTKRYAMSKQSIRQALDAGDHTAIVVDPHGAEQILQFCVVERIHAYSVWVDCGPVEQARRWLAREAAWIAHEHQRDAAAQRLGLMLGEEIGWRTAASMRKIQLTGRYWYNQTIDSVGTPPKALAFSVLEGVKRSSALRDNATAQLSGRYGTFLPPPDMGVYLNRPDIH